jgi:AcrR family transcriptional regulator
MSDHQQRRRLRPLERRALIVEAAGHLFAQRGYDGTRLDDVAAAAGVTKPVLYRHFAGKAALYLALLERHRQDLGGFVEGLPADGTLEERLRTVLEVWFAYAETHSYAWVMLFRDTGGGAEITAFRRDVHAQARTVLAAAIEALAEWPVPKCELDPLAEMMTMARASLVLWWIETPQASRAGITSAMTRLWVRLLSPP